MKTAVKWISVIFAIALLSMLVQITALAFPEKERASYEQPEIVASEAINEGSGDGIVRDDLSYSYVSPSESRLNALEKSIYDELKSNVLSIAKGNLNSTTISITSDLSSLSWTEEDLGCTIANGTTVTEAAKQALAKKLGEAINFNLILRCLLADCPYELFWYDKTIGMAYSYTYGGTTKQLNIKSLTYNLTVSEDYRAGGVTDYKVDTAKISGANIALANAKAIVEKYKNKSDLEKLEAYKNEICALVSYNDDAANGAYAYGNPWQLIYVFDGDPNTNVVCEGYSKAFKYLCDLSTFEKNISCYILDGVLDTDNVSGGHMWNVVSINGMNYLVDVTNCDSSYQVTSYLFLVGGKASNSNRTYTISWKSGIFGSTTTFVYTYYDNQGDLFCDGFVVLSDSSYSEHTHSYSWTGDSSQHWQECFCGDKINTASHTEKSPATCTKKAVCLICNAEYGETLDHTYNKTVASNSYLKSEATCTKKALYYFSCECGARGSESFEHGSLASHSYTEKDTDSDYLKSEATCTEKALYYFSCECGAKGIESFEYGKANGHNYVDSVCDVCGDVSTTPTPPPAGGDDVPDNNDPDNNDPDNNDPDNNDPDNNDPDNNDPDNDDKTEPAPLPEEDDGPKTIWEWIIEIILAFIRLFIGSEE